jgi:hypothetical protein
MAGAVLKGRAGAPPWKLSGRINALPMLCVKRGGAGRSRAAPRAGKIIWAHQGFADIHG